MIEVTQAVYDQVVAHARAEAPIEACGLLSARGSGQRIDGFDPICNDAASATEFVFAPAEMLAVESALEEAGREVVGVMHSHPTTEAYPSPTDIAAIGRFDPFGVMVHLIVSLRAAEPEVAAFRVLDGNVLDEPVVCFS